MFKWQTNTEPMRFPFRWILGIFPLVCILLITEHVYATTVEKTLSGNPPGDMPVIVAVGVRESCWVSEKMAKRTGNDLRPMGVWRQGVTG